MGTTPCVPKEPKAIAADLPTPCAPKGPKVSAADLVPLRLTNTIHFARTHSTVYRIMFASHYASLESSFKKSCAEMVTKATRPQTKKLVATGNVASFCAQVTEAAKKLAFPQEQSVLVNLYRSTFEQKFSNLANEIGAFMITCNVLLLLHCVCNESFLRSPSPPPFPPYPFSLPQPSKRPPHRSPRPGPRSRPRELSQLARRSPLPPSRRRPRL